jgi:hypothetical protein
MFFFLCFSSMVELPEILANGKSLPINSAGENHQEGGSRKGSTNDVETTSTAVDQNQTANMQQYLRSHNLQCSNNMNISPHLTPTFCQHCHIQRHHQKQTTQKNLHLHHDEILVLNQNQNSENIEEIARGHHGKTTNSKMEMYLRSGSRTDSLTEEDYPDLDLLGDSSVNTESLLPKGIVDLYLTLPLLLQF